MERLTTTQQVLAIFEQPEYDRCMERLTHREWQIVMTGLHNEVRTSYQEALGCFECGFSEGGYYWSDRIVLAQSAYSKMLDTPLAQDESDDEPYDEPYEPLYQEPDSFYTYEPYQDSWE